MSLSEVCFQQHENEQKNLKRLLLWGLLASLGAHGIALTLGRFDLWQESPDQLTPIELIIAEPPTEPEPVAPQPAELSMQTSDPAAATASAPPRAVQAAAPAIVTPPAGPIAPDLPQPMAETQAESTFEERQQAVEPDAEAAETPSETLRDLLQRLRGSQAGSETSTGAGPVKSATSGGGTVPDAAAGTSRGVAAERTATNGRGQGQGSRTVACDNCVRPSYPQSALSAGVEGQPKVSVDINPDGSVRSVTLTRSSGNAAIDQAVIQAARRSRFQPVTGGASVPIEYDLTIEGSRRHREARRRGERQAVDVPTKPAPTTAEAAGTPPPAPSRPLNSGAEASPVTPPVSSQPIQPEPSVSDPAPDAVPELSPTSPSPNTPMSAPESAPSPALTPR